MTCWLSTCWRSNWPKVRAARRVSLRSRKPRAGARP
jgi:hypothetical protein